MPKINVAPTKTNLLRVQRDLSFAREGHDLLEQKRQILVAELLGLMDSASDAEQSVEEALRRAYHALEEALLRMGKGAVRGAARAAGSAPRVLTSSHHLMGVALPIVRLEAADREPAYGLAETSFWLDESAQRFREALKEIAALCEKRISLLRLAREVARTVRRVNALEKIYIPEYEETLEYIRLTLEESERQAFYLRKLLKERMERRSTQRGGEGAP